VFHDPRAVSQLDRVKDEEERWQTLGLAGGILILLVVHTYREESAKKCSESFPLERRPLAKGRSMNKVSRRQNKELAALAALRDDKIDFSDAPEVRDWSRAVVGKFYRPIKKSLTIRLDADVLAWLKSQGRGYQTRLNRLLRAAMEGASRRRRA
jgi:uncharacterized protein (DUF4415 family)